MAKITIAGEAVVITSSMKLEDIKTIQKYRPEALTLFGGEEGKEPIFKIGVSEGFGTINKYGAEFGSATHDDEKKAVITLTMTTDDGNLKEFVADTIGTYVLKLNELESKLPAILADISAQKTKILENITVAQ